MRVHVQSQPRGARTACLQLVRVLLEHAYALLRTTLLTLVLMSVLSFFPFFSLLSVAFPPLFPLRWVRVEQEDLCCDAGGI